MKKTSHMTWSWTIMVAFVVLSIVDLRFGLGMLLCMSVPMYQAFKGNGKIHCSHYCPRGSLLGKFLSKISLRNTLPAFMRTKNFKNGLLAMMILMLTLAIYSNHSSVEAVGLAFFRFMVASSVVGILLGIFYQPRSWCQVCPMGHVTGLVTEFKKQQVA